MRARTAAGALAVVVGGLLAACGEPGHGEPGHGEPVLDAAGREVVPAGTGSTPRIVAAAAADDPIVFAEVPEFTLVDQAGATRTRADYAGAPFVLATIYTTCTGPCPSVTREVGRLARRLDGTDARFVSLSVDPERDTPDVLAAYAASFEADPARWSFLTGEPDEVASLIREGFKMPFDRLPEPDPVTGDEITHDVRLVVVDAEGRIRGWYRSDDPGERDRLVARVRFLADGR